MGMDQFIRENRWFDSAVLVVFTLAFTGATCNHVADMLRGGLFPYAAWYGVPEIYNWYWTGLTVLDPLAVVALWFNVRVGYMAALGIMLTDVPINWYVNTGYWKLPLHENPSLMMQTAFLAFLLCTARRIWRLSGSGKN